MVKVNKSEQTNEYEQISEQTTVHHMYNVHTCIVYAYVLWGCAKFCIMDSCSKKREIKMIGQLSHCLLLHKLDLCYFRTNIYFFGNEIHDIFSTCE